MESSSPKKGLLKLDDGGTNPDSETDFKVSRNGSSISISEEEKALNGAPQGELFVATVVEREAIIAAPDNHTAQETILTFLETAASGKVFAWYDSFAACDRVRGVAIHAAESGAIHPQNISKLMSLLAAWGKSSRSVLAHNAICAVADCLHFLPGTVASSAEATAAAVDLLLDTSKKNKPRVLKERVKNVLGEVCNALAPSPERPFFSSSSVSSSGPNHHANAEALVVAMLLPAAGVTKWAG